MKTHYDTEAIKAAHPLPEFFEAHGVQLTRTGAAMEGRCPFHREQNGSALTVWPEEGRWRCFGKCNRGGDVIAAVELLRGVDFQTACEILAQNRPLALAYQYPASKPAARPLSLSRDQICQQDAACRALRDVPDRIAELAGSRDWLPETVHGLAMDGHLGLHRGNLAFIYNHGLKYRWQQAGERRIAWAFGGNRELWRDDRLWPKDVRRVYICEGETDAISLLDAGAELDPSVAVVAIPGASCWRPEWNVLFRDRTAVILTDSDAAGEKAAARIATELAEWAHRVIRIDPANLTTSNKTIPTPN